MGMTMTQKILAAHAGEASVKAGQLIQAKLDIVMGNDITTAVALKEFQKTGAKEVFDKDKVVIVLDHFTPNKDIKAAEQCLQCRTFARQFDLDNFYDVGQMGVEHALLPEKGLVAAGECIIGADSHTCTYGALGAFSTGVGSTDMAAGMATGETWFKVPEAIRVHLTGKLQPWVSGKDVILHLIGLIGVDGALYKALEFGGETLSELDVEARLCISNMAIEAGGKCGLFPSDEKTLAYCRDHNNPDAKLIAADAGATYERIVRIDVSGMEPQVSCPHLPENTKPVSEVKDVTINQVVIGSCTNGRLEDLRVAASIMKGHHKADNIHRVLVVPASSRVRLQAEKEGLDKIFKDFGAEWRNAGCSMCLGMNPDKMVARERSISTSNRNFEGRQGKGSRTHLASPAVAAATAIRGTICSPADL